MKWRLEAVANLQQLRRLASALDHMAAAGIVHRDIKPKNIILRESNVTPVIVDFGLAVNLATYAHKEAVVGTAYYLCPEATRAEMPTAAFDAYALGVTFAFLLLRQKWPFESITLSDILKMKQEGRFDSILKSKLEASCAEEIVPFVEDLVHQDPRKRIETIRKLAPELE